MRNSVLPIATTKVGPGEKERAYVVRQNAMLKFLLGMVILVTTISTALVCTRYEVSVQRRQGLSGAKAHREEEHASHMRVMRLSMLLQKHLEDEVHDVAVLTTYRAWLMRAVGDYQMRVARKAANCSASLVEGVQAEGVAFDAEIEKLIKLLWDDVVREGKAAQKSLHNITHAIVSELRDDSAEQGEYERVMADAGEDAGAFGYHHHEVEWHHHGHVHDHDPDDEFGRRDDYGRPDGEEGEEDGGFGGYHEDDDEEHLAGALESLLERLKSNDSVVVTDNVTLAKWTKLHDSALNALSDAEQEVDMERVNKRILASVSSSDAVGLPAYNETEYDSELDYLTDVMHRARLAPFREELVGILEAWQAGDVRISEPLNRVEQLIDDEVLEPDVLMWAGNYDHYRYNDED